MEQTNLDNYTETPKVSQLQYGWICPKCGRVYSPFTSMCPYCGNADFKITC